MKNKFLGVLMAAALCAMPLASNATPITPGAGWYGFCFEGVGSGATAGCQNDGIGTAGNTMTFTLAGPGFVKVTDAFLVGEQFEVYIDSVLAFTTSAPGIGPDGITDPDAAFASGYFSAGSFAVGAGAHTIDIIVLLSPFGFGGAYVTVEERAAVPLPGTAAILALSLAGLGYARRRMLHA